MTNDTQWNEVGDSYPSCESIYVRKNIVGPSGGGITLTPPLILDDTRTVGTSTLGALAVQGVSTPLTGTTRITLKSKNAGSDSSVIRWLRSDDALRWSLGTDVNGNGNNNLWLFDNAQGIYGLYFPSGAAGDTTGSIRWGIGGRIAYDTATNAMTRRVNNVVRETLDPTQYTLTSGGTVQLTSTLGMALQGGAGLILQSLDNATLQATNMVTLQAGTDVDMSSGGTFTIGSAADISISSLDGISIVTVNPAANIALSTAEGNIELHSGVTGAAGDLVLSADHGNASLLANGTSGNITVAGPGLITVSTPADVNVTGTSSVTIASGAGTVDVNGLGVVTLDSVAGVVLGGAAHPVGFYGSAGVVKQVGVPVTAAGIHAALVALNLIAP